jgi:hypothetical protein
MSSPTSTITLEEKKQRLQVLRAQCSNWLSTTDGSYEMALDDVGYYKLLKEITEQEAEQ